MLKNIILVLTILGGPLRVRYYTLKDPWGIRYSNMESTRTWGQVGSGGLKNPGALFSSRCNLERRAVAKGILHDLWPGVRRLTHRVSLEIFEDASMMMAILHR